MSVARLRVVALLVVGLEAAPASADSVDVVVNVSPVVTVNAGNAVGGSAVTLTPVPSVGVLDVTRAPVTVRPATPVVAVPSQAVFAATPAVPATVVVRPVAPPGTIMLRPGPGILTVTPGTAPPPAAVVAAQPVCGAVCDCGSDVAVYAGDDVYYGESDDSVFDIEVFGVYRGFITEDISAGGVTGAVRTLLTDDLSLELSIGYLSGGDGYGAAYEEVPAYLNMLVYPWQRDWFNLYVGIGNGVIWTSRWRDEAQGSGLADGNWWYALRLATGVEFAFFDFLLLTAEFDIFGAFADDSACPADEDGPCVEAGFSASAGLGFRF